MGAGDDHRRDWMVTHRLQLRWLRDYMYNLQLYHYRHQAIITRWKIKIHLSINLEIEYFYLFLNSIILTTNPSPPSIETVFLYKKCILRATIGRICFGCLLPG
jgi:hypothetical protein